MKRKNNILNFNIYVFMSTFARDLIELFVALILYKEGYNLKNIMLFYSLIYAFGLIFSYPMVIIAKKITNKLLTIISVLSFFLFFQLLLNISVSLEYLLLLALLYGIYRTSYWLSRRYYNFRVIKKNDIGKYSSIISITNQFGKIIAVYIASITLDYNNIELLAILSCALFILSLYPLSNIEFEHDKNKTKIDIKKTIKRIELPNIFLIGSYELIKTVQFMIPIYLFIYIKNNFQIIGIMGVYTNLSVLLFAYIYGKSVDKSKNMLHLSIFLTIIAYILKINVVGIALIVASVMEGIVTRMYDVSISKYVVDLSKKFEYNNYNLAYEIILNIFRGSLGILCYLYLKDIKAMIYLSLLIMSIAIFINFKKISKSDYILEK